MKNALQLFLFVMFASLIIVVGAHAQLRPESITKRNVEINRQTTIWVAVQHLADNGIPIGFEAREHWNPDTDPKVILRTGTVKEILDSAVKQDGFYNWEEVDGVINVYPVKDRCERCALFLARRLGPLTVSTDDDRASVVERVSNLFDGGRGNEMEFHSVIGRGNHLGLPDKLSEQVNIPASDLKTILNKVTRGQPYSPIWTVTPSQDRKIVIVMF